MSRPKGSPNKPKKKPTEAKVPPAHQEYVEEARKSYGETTNLMVCGFASYAILHLLAKLPVPALQVLEKEVNSHITQLPFGLVLIGLFVTAISVLLAGARIDMFVRKLVAIPLTTLAAHLTSLWFGSLVAVAAIKLIAAGFESYAVLSILSALVQFPIVVLMQAATVVSTGAIDRKLNSTLANVAITLVCLVAIYLIATQLLQTAANHSSEGILPLDGGTIALSILTLGIWTFVRYIFGATIDQRSAMTSPLVTQSIPDVLSLLRDDTLVAKAYLHHALAAYERSADQPQGRQFKYLSKDGEIPLILTLVMESGRRFEWSIDDRRVRIRLQVSLELFAGEAESTYQLTVTCRYALDESLMKRTIQRLITPPGADATYFLSNLLNSLQEKLARKD